MKPQTTVDVEVLLTPIFESARKLESALDIYKELRASRTRMSRLKRIRKLFRDHIAELVLEERRRK